MTDRGCSFPVRRGMSRAAWLAAAGLLALALVLPSGRLASSEPEPAAPPALTPALAERGASLYTRHCAACHGETGRGDGKAAYLLYPKPRDFTQVRFRLVTTENRVPSPDDLFRTITRGMPGSAMPSWAQYSVSDRWALVFQVQKLMREGKVARLVEEDAVDKAEAEKIAARLTTPGPVLPIPAEAPVTPEALERGKQVYTEICVACHDADGRGRRKRDLKDGEDYPIFARDFTQGIFKGGSSSQELASRFLVGMPGTPMPSFKDNIKSTDDLWALIHYVQSYVAPGAQERVQQRQLDLRILRVAEDQVLNDPSSAAWQKAAPTWIPLMPLWWRDERVEGVEVRAIRTATQVAFQLSWRDGTRNDMALLQNAFSDGAAIQLSPSQDPPFFGMGAKTEPVNIWSWKASWESDLASYRDVQDAHSRIVADRYQSLQDPPIGRHSPVGEFPTAMHDPNFLTGWGAGNVVSHPKRQSSVEDLNAQGFSTLTNQGRGAQSVFGKARWDDGTWRVVYVRDLGASDAADIIFRGGQTISIAFAVWDGATGDRNGQKSVSIWHRLRIDE